ncbi:sequence-specific DNA-binding high mobility group box protein mat-Mc, partial [Coemansia reversa NRRL 1564]
KRTPRPPNAFILYRKAKQAEVIRDNPGVSNKDVSCIIGHMWKNEDPAVQDKYREQAELEKKKHKEMHPNYKYQPRK